MRLDVTSDDLSITINGNHIARVHNEKVSDLNKVLNSPETQEKILQATQSYSEFKVGELLNYSPDTDYELPILSKTIEPETLPTGYYLFCQVMKLNKEEVQRRFGNECQYLDAKAFSDLKYDIAENLCIQLGIEYPKEVSHVSESGINFSSIMRQTQQLLLPLQDYFEKRNIDNHTQDAIKDYIARQYTPDDLDKLIKGTQKIAQILDDLFKARKANVLTPTGEELVVFVKQLSDRVFAKTTDPLNIIMVTCPRYNQDMISDSASAYLAGLPRLTSILTKYGIPYEGHILIDDAEEKVAGGAYLSRLGMTKESYEAECDRNVKAVARAISDDDILSGISAQRFGEMFPDFINTVSSIERQLFKLSKSDSELKLSLADVANSRFARHSKILGGICDFSDSLYLAIHYTAEYMALGYLSRSYPGLKNNGLIINYNSPNVGKFNTELLTKCISGSISSRDIGIIPVFQVKLY